MLLDDAYRSVRVAVVVTRQELPDIRAHRGRVNARLERLWESAIVRSARAESERDVFGWTYLAGQLRGLIDGWEDAR